MANQLKTKSALAGAFCSLIEGLPFSGVTVTRICAACGMNRKSFYYHFKDQYDLVFWIFHRDLAVHKTEKEPVFSLLGCLAGNRILYGKLLSQPGKNPFREEILGRLSSLVQAHLHPALSEHTFFVRFFEDACLSALTSWLFNEGSVSPDEFAMLLIAAIENKG